MSLRKSVRANLSGKRIGAAKPDTPRRRAETAHVSTGTRAVLVVLVCVVGLAMLLAARESSDPAGAPPALVADGAGAAKTAAAPARRPPIPVKAAAAATNVVAGGVTIEGCLEKGNAGYRLKNTSGADAPRSRSWKSGFLKNGSAPVAIAGASGGVKLASHVGERVSVTGPLIDREMHVQTLRRVAATCK